MISVMAKSMARCRSRNNSRRASADQFHRALFLCLREPSGGLYVGAFGLAGSLEAGLRTTYSPPFLFRSGKGGS